MRFTPTAVPGHGKRSGSAAARCSGFSLVELLVTLALLGLVAGLALPYAARHRHGAGLHADARLLAASLRAARETALAGRTATAVMIDLAPPGIQAPPAQGEVPLPSTEHLSILTARGPEGGPSATITFTPDGGSSGAEIRLHAGPQQVRVTVDWLTGRVTLGGIDP